MIAALAPLAGALLVVATLADTAVGAIIAGGFTLVNTLLGALVLRDVRRTQDGVRHTHRILTAPRRAVYDSEGRLIGTVLRLEGDEDWRGHMLPLQRADDRLIEGAAGGDC